MENKCILIVFAMISHCLLVDSLTGPNVCMKTEMKPITRSYYVIVTVNKNIVYCCGGTGTCSTQGTCSNIRQHTETRLETITVQVPVNISICCEGYRQSGDTCEPICESNKCVRGQCARPEFCDCTGTGYTGPVCDTISCESDTRSCTAECLNSSPENCQCHPCYTPMDGKCLHRYKCLIDGTCYQGGAVKQNGCQKCIPVNTRTKWTASARSRMCDDGNKCTRIDRCDGAGHCVGQSFACIGECNECNGMTCFLNDACLVAKTTTTSSTTTTTTTPSTTTTTTTPSTTTTTTTPSTTTTTTTPSTTLTTTTPPTTSTTTMHPKTPIDGQTDVLSCTERVGTLVHPIPFDCGKFFYCATGHPRPYIISCPVNTYFEPTKHVCVHKYQLVRQDCF